ncbi:MAG: tetratricopeptide repeat protein [Deltaproteobacteria bacterium]|nr:tetratricopeptide repeat protein [Deltaproteobacteria bacterium]
MSESPASDREHEPAQERDVTIPEAIGLAIALHREGRQGEAERIYRAVLEAAPEHPDALNFLGVLSHQQGRSAEAERLLRSAVEQAPDHPDALNNLGNVLEGTGNLREAEAAYRRVLELNPAHHGAQNNLGVVLKAQGRLEEAVATLTTAAAQRPEAFDAHLNLGNALRRLGRIREAVDAHLRAIALKPELTDSPKLRIYALHAAGRTVDALKRLDEWLAAEPDNPMAAHLRAAVSGEGVPERASDRFVRETFDGFAPHFDELLANLRYRAPELVAEVVAEALAPPAADRDVADLGCGTGLCGPFLRPYARRLTGVDLSSGMVARAEARGIYDELATAELTEFLAGRPEAYDLLASADTLCYFGALEAVFAAAAAALRPRGLFAFTLERAASGEEGKGFVLQHHGRYRHGESYVRSRLAAAGLETRSVCTAALRTEAGAPVEGLVVLAARPSGG